MSHVFAFRSRTYIGLALAAALGSACSGDDPDAAPPTIESFEATPALVERGRNTRLAWVVVNAERITIIRDDTRSVYDDVEGRFDLTTDLLTEPTTYVMTATNAAGMAHFTVRVGILPGPAPQISEFRADPDRIEPGESADLRWNTQFSTSVYISANGAPLVENGITAGALTITPTVSTAYELTARGQDGTTTATASIVVRVPGPAIETFTIDPTAIFPGETATLTWSAPDATMITVENDAGTPLVRTSSTNGTLRLSPTSTTTYTLIAENEDGARTQSATLRVDAPLPPEIITLSANATQVVVGATVTVSYAALRGRVSRVFVDDVLFDTVAATEGSFRFATNEDRNAVRLEVDNPLGSTTARLDVFGHRAPSIDAFSVAPQSFSGSADVTVSWSARNVSRLELTSGGDPVAGFTAITSTTTTMDDAGNVTVTLAATTEFRLEAESAAGIVINRITSVRGGREAEPNDDAGSATVFADDDFDALGRLDGPTDQDWYEITVPAGASVRAATSGLAVCEVDTELTLFEDDAATVVAMNDDGPLPPCSVIDPAIEPAATNLAGGTYYLRVRSPVGAVGDYVLSVLIRQPGCANGLLETGEECDDGNLAPADGCSAACTLEGLPENEAGANGQANDPGVVTLDANGRFFGAIAPIGDIDFFGVVVPDGYHLEAYLTVDSLVSCASGTAELTLFDRDGLTQLAADGTSGPSARCGRIAPNTTPVVLNLRAGTYFLRVNETGNDARIDTYFLHVRIIEPGCGNRVIDGGETCDDGNQSAGDGCDGSCVYEISAPDINPPGGTVGLNFAAAGHERVHRVNLTIPGQSISAIAAEGGANCNVVDTRIELRDAAFALLGAQTENGPTGTAGNCAAVEAGVDGFVTDLAAGTYYLVVRASSGSGASSLAVTIVNPSCGNGIREGQDGESCDDGNTMSGDGCSSMCVVEVSSGPEVEPNDDQANATPTSILGVGGFTVTGAMISPSGDDDVFSLVIPAGQTARLTARTYTTPGQPMSCDSATTDTRLLLEAAGSPTTGPGTGELAYNDDIDNAGNIWCSALIDVPLGAGSYFLRVQGWDDTATASYELDVTLAP